MFNFWTILKVFKILYGKFLENYAKLREISYGNL